METQIKPSPPGPPHINFNPAVGHSTNPPPKQESCSEVSGGSRLHGRPHDKPNHSGGTQADGGEIRHRGSLKMKRTGGQQGLQGSRALLGQVKGDIGADRLAMCPGSHGSH